jgi:hypothetical protein
MVKAYHDLLIKFKRNVKTLRSERERNIYISFIVMMMIYFFF